MRVCTDVCIQMELCSCTSKFDKPRKKSRRPYKVPIYIRVCMYVYKRSVCRTEPTQLCLSDYLYICELVHHVLGYRSEISTLPFLPIKLHTCRSHRYRITIAYTLLLQSAATEQIVPIEQLTTTAAVQTDRTNSSLCMEKYLFFCQSIFTKFDIAYCPRQCYNFRTYCSDRTIIAHSCHITASVQHLTLYLVFVCE